MFEYIYKQLKVLHIFKWIISMMYTVIEIKILFQYKQDNILENLSSLNLLFS